MVKKKETDMRQQLLLDTPPVFESGYLLPIAYFIINLSTFHPFLSSPERVIQEKNGLFCYHNNTQTPATVFTTMLRS